MARIFNDGNTKVTWVPAIANIAAPAAAVELNGASAVDLQGFLTPDGFDIQHAQASIDVSVLASTAEFSVPGRYKLDTKLVMQRDGITANDKAWTTAVAGTAGFLVVRRGVPAGNTYAAADKLEVYNVTFGKRMNDKPTKNSIATFTVMLSHSGADTDSAVAAA